MPETHDQSHADPDAIERFAESLSGYSARLEEFEYRLEANVSRLGLSFSDEKYEEFRDLIARDRDLLRRFQNEVIRVVPLLKKDAERLRLAQRLSPEAR